MAGLVYVHAGMDAACVRICVQHDCTAVQDFCAKNVRNSCMGFQCNAMAVPVSLRTRGVRTEKAMHKYMPGFTIRVLSGVTVHSVATI